ncbi:hypothetical protein AZI86_12990 [Bdellovibrio bacteriovorus]|uniref:HPt domain-containing protein n=1 Tax=Bdellovibrio bacteriovorus TaxID=959 RepID=A0A150WJ72_BDEBC|nr:Hpt domain-containing protein [Bdellovibrio bacteriovorus]KYG63734.1 hypothetical protein AZI86_12990 [Bdellovibrio bacteriovorus]
MSSGMAVPLESQVKYLQRRTTELAQIRSSLLSQPDWDLVKKVGHQIKGNASTFGFAQLTEFGKNLEVAAAQGDVLQAQQISEKLEQEVQRLLKTIS